MRTDALAKITKKHSGYESLTEQYHISALHKTGMSLSEITRQIGRTKLTVSRV